MLHNPATTPANLFLFDPAGAEIYQRVFGPRGATVGPTGPTGTGAQGPSGVVYLTPKRGKMGLPIPGPPGATITIGGGSGLQLLASKSVRNGSDTATYTTTSTTAVAVDATNLAPTFIVPSSGQVLVHLECSGAISAVNPRMLWCLISGGSTVANTTAVVQNNNIVVRLELEILISGLTPGASLTYQWGWFTQNGAVTATLYTGPTFGSADMRIYAVNALVTNKTIVIPITGFSNTIGSNNTASIIAYVLNPAGTLATGTITMPATPLDGQIVTISSTQTITGLTLSANAGQSIDNAVTTLGAGPLNAISYIYDVATTTWYPSR